MKKITIGTEKQIKWANDIRDKLNIFLDIIKDSNIKRLNSKGKDTSKMLQNMKNIHEKLNIIEDSKFFIDNLKELTNSKISESDKIFCIGKLSDKSEEFKKLGVYASFTQPFVKQYVENEDEIIATGIKAKDMEEGKYYRIEETVIIKGVYANSLQKIWKGTVLALNGKDVYGNYEIIFKGYIQGTDSNSKEFTHSNLIDFRYNRNEVSELDLVEINYKGKFRDLLY